MNPLARSLWQVVGAMWIGAWAGFTWGLPAVAGALAIAGTVLVVGGGRYGFVGVAVVVGAGAGLISHTVDQAQLAALTTDTRRVTFVAGVVTDPDPGRFGWRQVVRPEALIDNNVAVPWRGPALSLETAHPLSAVVGDVVEVTGQIRSRSGFVGRLPVAGVVAEPEVLAIERAMTPLRGLANAIRVRVLDDLDPGDRGEGLLAGFLVGDTTGVSDADLDALRRSGLTHYVAVSGSNVVVFLGLWWLVLAPLARHPRWRAGSGLVGVLVFVLVTRAEPSVVRAGAMVSVLLVGRLFGWAFDRWTALALGVLGCLGVSGRLAADVGFQLSVAATIGVMAGANRLKFEPRAVATVVGASLSAQVAVAPIMLTAFGSMPLLSPLANLVAAPLVTAATVTGGIGTLAGVAPLVWVGSWLADLVLFVATVASPWPQVGPWVAVGVLAAGLAIWRLAWMREPMALAGALAIVLMVYPGGSPLDRPSVVFLDVGQGDSELIVGDGFTVLIDGGPDPVILKRRLEEFRIGRIDLLIVSHVHADHIEGLRSVVGLLPVGEVWVAFEHQSTPASEWLADAAPAAGLVVRTPPIGAVLEAGGVRIEVLGPLRRYASPNDQSIVVAATIDGRRFLFPGDIEVIAQTELAGLTADVLKVPHQGAATSDPDWLTAVGAEIAVVSVGPNSFGHPADWVIDTLEHSGAVVKRTDLDGDVIVGPDGLSSPRPWWRLWP